MMVARSSGRCAACAGPRAPRRRHPCRRRDRSSSAASSMRPDVVEVGERRRGPRRRSPRVGALDDARRPAAGVAQDPLDLLGGGGLVDRARSPRPRTRSRSRSASTRSGSRDISATRSPAPTPAAIRPLASGLHLGEEVAAGDVEPPAARTAAEDDLVRCLERRC